MRKALVAVAIGDKYIRQTEVMIESFLQHNPEWDPVRFYDADVDKIIPDAAKDWNPFSKCEIGRWCALRIALKNGFDHALYSDGDMFWYGSYPDYPKENDAAIVLSPHYLLMSSKRERVHLLIKDGMPNLGLIKARSDAAETLDIFIWEVMRDPRPWFHGIGIWLQTISGIFAATGGFDVLYDQHPGVNVGNWNLTIERQIVKIQGHPHVLLGDLSYPLVALHFSKYHKMRGRYGLVMDRLLSDYEWLLK